MKKLELTGKSQSQIKTNLIEIMLPINPNNGKVNCAHVALKLDEILYNKELQDTKPVPKQDANLSTYPEYDMATGDIVKSFCADSRLVQRCLGSVPSLGVMDLTAENHMIVDLTDSNRPASPSNDTVKLYKTTYAQACDRLKDLPLRDADGSAHGFILYTHKDKIMGHLTNFLVDANNNVYFLDAQDNKHPQSFVRNELAPGYCDEIFFVQSKPKNAVRIKLVKQENINQGVNPVTISTTTTSSVVQNNTIIGNTIHINCDTTPESITNLPVGVTCVQINKDANPAAVAKLPASVTAVKINKDVNPAAVAKLPASVTGVQINKDANLEAVAKLPESVTRVGILHDSNPEAVAKLPASVTSVVISKGSNPAAVEKLPASVKRVRINKEANPAAVAKLPASVFAVHINKNSNPEAVAKLPASVTRVVILHDSNPEAVAMLPASVHKVGIGKDANPEAVAMLPTSVIEVAIFKNSNPEAVASLPVTVKTVRVDIYSNQVAVAKIPASVKDVIIAKDASLETITMLPENLRIIRIDQPVNLANTVSIIQKRNNWPYVFHNDKIVLAAKINLHGSSSTAAPTLPLVNYIIPTITDDSAKVVAELQVQLAEANTKIQQLTKLYDIKQKQLELVNATNTLLQEEIQTLTNSLGKDHKRPLESSSSSSDEIRKKLKP